MQKLLTNKKGSIFLEGLIVMTLISALIVLIFSYIQRINEGHTNKIHKERATLLMIETFEKLYSARESAINKNSKHGWNEFIKNIDIGNEEVRYVVKKATSNNSHYTKGQLYVEKEKSDQKTIFSSEISPYADYTTSIKARKKKQESDLEERKNKIDRIAFEVTVQWKDSDEEQVDLYSVSQELILTNHKIYENLY